MILAETIDRIVERAAVGMPDRYQNPGTASLSVAIKRSYASLFTAAYYAMVSALVPH